MKAEQTLAAVPQLVIRNLQRIHRKDTLCLVQPAGMPGLVENDNREYPLNAWTAVTSEGNPVHIAYHTGELTIQVDLPTPSGGRSPLTVMRWKPTVSLILIEPLIVEAEMIAKQPKDESAPEVRKERYVVPEPNAIFAEIRANSARSAGHISTWEVYKWLHDHNRHFAILSAHNLAGSRIRFRTAKLENEAKAA